MRVCIKSKLFLKFSKRTLNKSSEQTSLFESSLFFSLSFSILNLYNKAESDIKPKIKYDVRGFLGNNKNHGISKRISKQEVYRI